MNWYPWVVFVHVAVRVVLFVMGHGASMWASTRSGRSATPSGSRSWLEMSSRASGGLYSGSWCC
jgi:hypothetical protein